MENNKKLSLIIGATVAAFSASLAHATDLSKVKDLTPGVQVAEGDEHGCSDGKNGGCSDKEKKEGKEASCKGNKKEGKEAGCKGHKKAKKKAAPAEAEGAAH